MTSITPCQTLLAWLGLVVLASASFGLSYLHLGSIGVAVALGIALVKAAVVVLIFMEVGAEPFTVRVTFVSALVFVAVLVFFMTADVVTRVPAGLLPPLR